MPSDATEDRLLKAVQRATTYAMAELDRVCGELGIAYVVYGGTAIGAVRHQGFIPWDDDVDVCMPRADYERFLVEAPGLLGDDFVLVGQHSDPDYPKTFAVMGLKGTVFVPQAAKKRKFLVPIGVDVFPMDVMPQDRTAFRRQRRRTWVWGRLLFLHGSPAPETGLRQPLALFASSVFHLVHRGMRLARVSARTLYNHWEKAARIAEDSGSAWLADYATQDPRRWSVRHDELFPSKRVPFEGIMVELAHDHDAMLRRGYGDYMTIPPTSERVNHKPVRVDFGKHDFLSQEQD